MSTSHFRKEPSPLVGYNYDFSWQTEKGSIIYIYTMHHTVISYITFYTIRFKLNKEGLR